MGILSSTAAITRYRVEGKPEEPVMETVAEGLRKNAIADIDEEAQEKSMGWTAFENPFKPDFEGASFVIGSHLVFCLRIDKKSVPTKIVNKHFNVAMAKKLADESRSHLTRNEKKLLKEEVSNHLTLRIPATPNIYDLLWNLEEGVLWFFSNQKGANEELETLFARSFGLHLIRIFPYTLADFLLDADKKDRLTELTPTQFTE